MNRLWDRVNAMSLRERFLLFAAVMAVLGALTDVLFVRPLTRLQSQRAEQIERQSAAMDERRVRLERDLARSRSARVAELEREIEAVQGEVAALEDEIARLSAGATDIEALRAVLQRVLRPTDKVALLRVTTAEAAAAPAAGALSPGIGLDITLGGGYLDLMEYLAALEAALPHARWSALRFTAETAPAQATVRIVTPREGP